MSDWARASMMWLQLLLDDSNVFWGSAGENGGDGLVVVLGQGDDTIEKFEFLIGKAFAQASPLSLGEGLDQAEEVFVVRH